MPLPPLTLDRSDQAAWPPDPLTAAERYRDVTPRRVLAYLVDALLIGLLTVCLHLLVGIVTIMSFGLLGFLHLLALPLVIALIYHPLLMAGPVAGTIGMRLFDLRIYDSLLPRPLSLPQAALHTVCFYGTLGLGAGLLLLIALFHPRRRTLHDLLAGAVILRRQEIHRR